MPANFCVRSHREPEYAGLAKPRKLWNALSSRLDFRQLFRSLRGLWGVGDRYELFVRGTQVAAAGDHLELRRNKLPVQLRLSVQRRDHPGRIPAGGRAPPSRYGALSDLTSIQIPDGQGQVADIRVGFADFAPDTVIGQTNFSTDTEGNMAPGVLVRLQDPGGRSARPGANGALTYQGITSTSTRSRCTR